MCNGLWCGGQRYRIVDSNPKRPFYIAPSQKAYNYDVSIRQKLRHEGGWARGAAQHSAHAHGQGSNMTDIFHAITQSIDSVLTCHYFDSFRENNTSRSATRSSSRSSSRRGSMSEKRLDTEPGGESTQ